MTDLHAAVLARLAAPDSFSNVQAWYELADQASAAIRAILDRHQPIPIGYGDDATHICGSCRFFTSEWPCPELADVAEALGIET